MSCNLSAEGINGGDLYMTTRSSGACSLTWFVPGPDGGGCFGSEVAGTWHVSRRDPEGRLKLAKVCEAVDHALRDADVEPRHPGWEGAESKGWEPEPPVLLITRRPGEGAPKLMGARSDWGGGPVEEVFASGGGGCLDVSVSDDGIVRVCHSEEGLMDVPADELEGAITSVEFDPSDPESAEELSKVAGFIGTGVEHYEGVGI